MNAKSLKWTAVVEVPHTPPKKVSESFVGPGYLPEGRDPDLDAWLSPTQPEGEPKKLIVWRLAHPMTAKEAAQALLGADEEDLSALARQIVEGGHTVVPAQAEDLVDRVNRGEDVGLRADAGHAHLFVRTGREDNGGLALLILFKGRDGLWHVPLSTCGLTSVKEREGIFFSRAKSP